jgi:cytochrome c oxidase assembly factor CtaG
VLSVAVLWGWHVPALYEQAVRSEALHTVEHLSFLATAFMFWWVVLQPSGRSPAPGRDVLYVFTAGLAGSALGALLTFAASPIYPSYTRAAAALGASPLTDQQLAGLIMWIPSGVVYLGFASWLFVRWLRVVEREALEREARPVGAIPAVPVPEHDPIFTGGLAP